MVDVNHEAVRELDLEAAWTAAESYRTDMVNLRSYLNSERVARKQAEIRSYGFARIAAIHRRITSCNMSKDEGIELIFKIIKDTTDSAREITKDG